MESSIAEFLLRQVACEHLPIPLSTTRGAAACAPPVATPRQMNDSPDASLANASLLSVLQGIAMRAVQILIRVLRSPCVESYTRT